MGVKHFIFGQEEEVNLQLAKCVQSLGCWRRLHSVTLHSVSAVSQRLFKVRKCRHERQEGKEKRT